MKNNKYIKIAAMLLCAIAIVMCMCACTNADSEMPEPTQSSENTIGGYEIKTNNMMCSVVSNGQYKYSYFESYEGNRKVEFYVGPTEMIIIDSNNVVEKYYMETFAQSSQTYQNPLVSLYSEMKNMDFSPVGEDVINDIHCNIYEATQTIVQSQASKIRYNLYSIKMEWLDGHTYEYKYYDYADGSKLISAEAPNEINPLITKDTKWVVDLDNSCVYHSETQQSIEFVVTNISTGEGLSPNGGTNESTEIQQIVRVYVNKDNGNAEYLKYSKSGNDTEIRIINEPVIEKPIICDDMIPMNNDEKQLVMMLIYMLETLI
jgi:hypothetical protein